LNAISFFQPSYLWALAALAIPVLIHLLNRKRLRKLDFSTLRFFKKSAVRAYKTRKLKRWLLLLTRALLLGVIAIVFSQPFDRNNPFASLANPNADLYCWVDPTKSMDYLENGTMLWQKALKLVDSLDKKIPVSARRFWYDENRNKFILKKKMHFEENFFSRHGPSFCGTMTSAYMRESANSSRPSILLLFSDFQENITREIDSFFLKKTIKTPVIFVACAPKGPWNFGIRNVAPSFERPSIVAVALAAVGADRKNAGVSAFLGDMRVGHDVCDLQMGAATTVTFEITEGGEAGGLIRLDDEDPFYLDNIHYYIRNESRRRRVLVIGDSVSSFPIAAAFHSIAASTWNPVVQRLPRDLRIGDVDSADLIVCNELSFIPQPLGLLKTTRSFGRKAILVSPAMDSQSLPAALSLIGKGKQLKLVKSDKPYSLAFYDTLSILWKGFHKNTGREAALYKYIEPLPGNILCFSVDRKPFAAHRIDSLGHSWIFFSSPLGRVSSNNLCETGFYVPLIDRTARFALECIHKEPDDWIAGRTRRNPFLGAKRPACVYDIRNIRCALWGNQPGVQFREPGLYRIAPDNEPSYWVAVNSDSQETALSYRLPKIPNPQANQVRLVNVDAFLHHLKINRRFMFSYGLWILFFALSLAEMLLWERTHEMRPGLDKPDKQCKV
jgi:hypothetical protein